MCLGVPGKIESVCDESLLTRRGKVRFGGILKEINLALVPDAAIGDYVVVHAGFAISRIEEAEAKRVFEFLKQIDRLDEV